MKSSTYNTSFHRYEVNSVYTSDYDLGGSGKVIKKETEKAKEYQKIQYILKLGE